MRTMMAPQAHARGGPGQSTPNSPRRRSGAARWRNEPAWSLIPPWHTRAEARLSRMKHDVMARKHPENIDDRPAGVSRPDPVAAKAAAIKTGQAHPPTWKTAIKRVLVLAIAGAAIYLVLPSLMAVLGSWPRLSALSPIWFTAALAAELASFTCNFALQRLALRTRGWFAVVTAGLAGAAGIRAGPGPGTRAWRGSGRGPCGGHHVCRADLGPDLD